MTVSRSSLQERIAGLDQDMRRARDSAEAGRLALVRELAQKLKVWLTHAIAELVENEFKVTCTANDNGSLPSLKAHIRTIGDNIASDIGEWPPNAIWPHRPEFSGKPNQSIDWRTVDHSEANSVLNNLLDSTLYRHLRKLLSQFGYTAATLSRLDTREVYGRYNMYIESYDRMRKATMAIEETHEAVARLDAREAWSKA